MTMTFEQVSSMYRAVQWSIDQSKAEQSHHNQNVWANGALSDEVIRSDHSDYRVLSCDSNMCVAGNSVVQAGDKLVVPLNYGYDVGETASAYDCVDTAGKSHRIRERAQELMGLTDMQADLLFNGYNTVEGLVDKAVQIAAISGYTIDFEI